MVASFVKQSLVTIIALSKTDLSRLTDCPVPND